MFDEGFLDKNGLYIFFYYKNKLFICMLCE